MAILHGRSNGVSSRPMREVSLYAASYLFMNPKRRMMLGAVLLGFSAILLCLLSSLMSFMAAQAFSKAGNPGNGSFGLHTLSLSPTPSTLASGGPTTSAAPDLVTTMPATGSRLVMLAVNQDTLTSLFASQLGVQ